MELRKARAAAAEAQLSELAGELSVAWATRRFDVPGLWPEAVVATTEASRLSGDSSSS